jgi:hypothetical protein
VEVEELHESIQALAHVLEPGQRWPVAHRLERRAEGCHVCRQRQSGRARFPRRRDRHAVVSDTNGVLRRLAGAP